MDPLPKKRRQGKWGRESRPQKRKKKQKKEDPVVTPFVITVYQVHSFSNFSVFRLLLKKKVG